MDHGVVVETGTHAELLSKAKEIDVNKEAGGLPSQQSRPELNHGAKSDDPQSRPKLTSSASSVDPELTISSKQPSRPLLARYHSARNAESSSDRTALGSLNGAATANYARLWNAATGEGGKGEGKLSLADIRAKIGDLSQEITKLKHREAALESVKQDLILGKNQSSQEKLPCVTGVTTPGAPARVTTRSVPKGL
mmetsp:Transcript_9372/g.14204  ORF Transcript_9372/g.14204 Transcript_9372/m.14204 type:complete len:195 (-) Transcript_9372:212-796(-)